MDGSVPQLFIPPCGTSSDTWRDGSPENTSPCADTSGDPDTGLRASCNVSLSCSPIGPCFMDTAEQWEPDDARVSRTVLRERGGETPPRHSPGGLALGKANVLVARCRWRRRGSRHSRSAPARQGCGTCTFAFPLSGTNISR